jgi:GT2 family glycosyltransferase
MLQSLKSLVRAWVVPASMDLSAFDEEWYLFKYPDVASRVRAGHIRSGRQHFIRHGFAEKREGSPAGGIATTAQWWFDTFKVTPSGAVFFAGWADIGNHAVDALIVEGPGTRLRVAADQLYRHRREDVEAALGLPDGEHEHGFWLFHASANLAEGNDYSFSLRTAHGLLTKARLRPSLVTDIEMRDFTLAFFDTRWRAGIRHHRDILDLDKGFGKEIIDLNRRILVSQVQAGVSHFRATPRRIAKSLVTCLYGLPEFLPLQVALFSDSQGFDEVEFIYVNNSPEHTDLLESEAKQAARLYDIPITVIHAGTNIGFAAANNLAAKHANSDRLLFVNPDVFPKDRDWLVKHDSFAATEAGRIFGACLYYDDGSAMHAGMYLVRDSFVDARLGRAELLDTWHFAKGFPDWVEDVRTTRIVPAVTGAFMSIERAHFEKLGGFDTDFIFGHYEDGDLCLRSAAAGQPVWYCADVRLWHMESKGSKRSSHHDGARRVNRWNLTTKWSSSAEAAGLAAPTTPATARTARDHAP